MAISLSQGNKLTLLPEVFVVVKCSPENVPTSIFKDFQQKYSFFSVSITPEECSVITPQNSLMELLPAGGENLQVEMDKNWRCFKVEGPLDFSLVGILHRILDPLKTANISVLAVGTYNTDYFLVKDDKLEEACRVLREKGFYVK